MKKRRYVFCGALVGLILLIYIFRLGQWQLKEGEDHAAQAVTSSSFVKLTAVRGEIVDRNGNTLAGNEAVYNIVYNRLTWNESTRNETLLKTVKLLESLDEAWVDRLPIVLSENGLYLFKPGAESEAEFLRSEDFLDLAPYASAEECMEKLIRRYGVKELEDRGDVRRVVSVRYNLERNYFSRSNPVVIAKDVSLETVTVLAERSDGLPGIEARVAQNRVYPEGDLAPHVVGTVGAISAEQYSAAKAAGNTYSASNVSGYTYTDRYGQSGIENAFETVLRGKNGKETFETDSTGAVLDVYISDAPQAGGTVWLTLDSDLQRATNRALAEKISSRPTEDCVAGAAVALDIHTGGILACASYPGYDLSRYTRENDYLLALYEDETRPLFNRALNGLFTPGSVFKPLVAVAALEEKIIEPDTTPVLCDGAYHYFAPDYEPICMGSHGETDLLGALRNSCNS